MQGRTEQRMEQRLEQRGDQLQHLLAGQVAWFLLDQFDLVVGDHNNYFIREKEKGGGASHRFPSRP